uniref:Di19 C-terminal domain-containing protein n=1 Tax=Cucumis sativus TaxID=3659 RepID=A0A0A0K9D8_CUCSA
MAPDPLLSFLCNAPVINESKTVQPEPSNKEKLEEKVVDDTLSERDVQLSSIPDRNQEEKTRRCDFGYCKIPHTTFSSAYPGKSHPQNPQFLSNTPGSSFIIASHSQVWVYRLEIVTIG